MVLDYLCLRQWADIEVAEVQTRQKKEMKAGDIYAQIGRYDEAKEILLMAYDRSPIGRMIIYKLAEIAIKTKEFDEAQEYYDEFVEIALVSGGITDPPSHRHGDKASPYRRSCKAVCLPPSPLPARRILPIPYRSGD